MKLLKLLVLTVIMFYVNSKALPLVLLHGLGDSCSNHFFQSVGEFIKEREGATYFKCIESGGSALDFITSFKHQADVACKHIKKDPNLVGKEIAILALSQGGLLARSILEECDFGGSVKKIVSVGGPQMGVALFPHCEKGPFCYLINSVTDALVYTPFIQNTVGPAGYFRVYNNFEAYLKGSTFLAELNNEVDHGKNDDYKAKMLGLEVFVLIKFTKDTMIIPKETAHFGFYNEKKEVVDFTQTDVYVNDTLGLKTLNEQGKLIFEDIEGNHLQFSFDDVEKKMIPYLR